MKFIFEWPPKGNAHIEIVEAMKLFTPNDKIQNFIKFQTFSFKPPPLPYQISTYLGHFMSLVSGPSFPANDSSKYLSTSIEDQPLSIDNSFNMKPFSINTAFQGGRTTF